MKINEFKRFSHNPYFNRWFSAIMEKEFIKHSEESHNPYFNRWFSAMQKKVNKMNLNKVTILILIDGFLQLWKKNL